MGDGDQFAKMDICYTITRYWPAVGGAEVHTHELVKRLSERHRVKVVAQLKAACTDWLRDITMYAPSEPEVYSDDRAEVYIVTTTELERKVLGPLVRMTEQIGALWYVTSPLLRRTFRGKVEEVARGCDLIHNVRAGPQHLSYASWDAAKRLKVPFVFTPIPHIDGEGNVFKAFSKLYRRADALIAMTEYERRWLIEQGARPEKVHTLGVGPVLTEDYDGESFKSKFNISGRMVLFVGQKYRYKGYLEILKASSKVWEEFPDTYFVFAGPRTRESVEIFSLYTDPRIVEVGPLSEREKTDAFAACDIFCMPSTRESFGGVFIEAWAMEKPVIAGNIPCERELIEDGVDGFLVEQDPEEVATKILQLLKDDELRRRMGRRGKEKVLAKYTWEKITSKMEEIYRKLVGR